MSNMETLGRHASQTAFDLFADEVLERIRVMRYTCALDAADDGGINNERIGALLGCTREGVRRMLLGAQANYKQQLQQQARRLDDVD